MSQKTFEAAVEIATPPETVWAVMSDVERWPEWTSSVNSVRLISAKQLGVGVRALIRQPKLLPAIWTVTAFEPGRSFVWRTGFPGMWAYGSHSVEPAAGGTIARLGVRYEGALAWLLAAMTSRITKRYVDIEAAGLKTQSERRR